jgi:hypothetical protein
MMEGTYTLRYGNHAKYEAAMDRYGVITLPLVLDTTKHKLIEIEVENDIVVKSVYRKNHKPGLDITVVVMRDGFVKTVWFNKTTDVHKTLDRSKYNRP